MGRKSTTWFDEKGTENQRLSLNFTTAIPNRGTLPKIAIIKVKHFLDIIKSKSTLNVDLPCPEPNSIT